MANCLPFSKNKSIVGETGTVTWTDSLDTQSPLNFSNPEDSLNDTYGTAVDINETQYLSVLDSGDDTLQEIHDITLSNEKLIVNDDIALNIEQDNNYDLTNSEQVVIFNIEGSDELYGIQVAPDEDGNIHRYQFQFRKTDDGQLEAMPETIQLLTNEEDQILTEKHTQIIEYADNQVSEEVFEQPVIFEEQSNEDSQQQLIISKQHDQHAHVGDEIYSDEEEGVTTENPIIYMKNESICTELTYDDQENELDEFESNYDEEIIDIKPGIIKQELINNKHEEFVDNSQNAHFVNSEETVLNGGYTSEGESYSTVETQGEETIISYQHFEPQDIEDHYENTDTNLEQETTHFLVDERNLDELNYNIELQQEEEDNEHNKDTRNLLIVDKNVDTNDSENEDFEIVEGLPVTAEGEINEDTSSTFYPETEVLYSEPEVSLQTFSTKDKPSKTSNILKQPTNMNKINDGNKKTILYYMVPSTDQKENLNSITLNSTNPRSVLKNNIELHKANDEHIKTMQREKLFEKRYARSKEVIQAKMFNNFINKTTIPHAPIRQGKMPRKQEIKPVDTRTNEEIIVQEVMVSSKGFVENLNDRLKNLDKLEVTSIVELSDSDEDYDPKNSIKKKKKHKKIKPTNAESSDSDTSIIEIYSDEETTVAENTSKRNRGRPKKDSEENLKRSRGKGSKVGSSDENSPQKKSRTEESSELESDHGKKEISCPNCSKTFPNQNSLSTHIQHHNLENSLRKNKKISTVEYKHKCEDCKQTFKNSILLKRHVCNSNKNSKPIYKCASCPKTFRDVAVFNIHKKSHVKENLLKSTSNITISPNKITHRPSTSSQFSVTYKCKECSKVCSSQSILSAHEKTHKKFICMRCKTSFNSKLLLDLHLRVQCVKASPKEKRLSFKIKRSFVSSPRRASTRGRSINPVKSLTHNTLTKKEPIPTSTNRKTINVVPKKSLNFRSNVSAIPGSKKDLNPAPKRSISLKPPNAFNPAKNVNCKQNRNINNSTNAKTENIKANSSVLETSNVGTSVSGLNSSSLIRTLDIEAQCDSCSMTFNSLTALFKHKVKVHGLSTPDKRVLETKKKSLHKPLHLHGGIPANQCLSKAFQEMRKNLMLANTDFSEDTNLEDNSTNSQETESSDKKLPTIIISKPTQSKQ